MIKESLIYILLSVVVFLALYGVMNQFETRPESATPESYDENGLANVEVLPAYQLPSIKIPDKVTFAGEEVPLHDPDIRERLDRELHVNTFFHSNTIFILKRGNRWLPQIEEVLNQYGIPDDFKYLAVIESDLTNAVSAKEAVGFWQILKDTAKEFGLEVDNEVDERYDPIKSTEAAAKYLLRSYAKFGNWTNSAASYNSGMRGLERSIEEQGVASYYDLLLNTETARYVLRAIAVKLIFEQPEKFGFRLDKDQLYHMEKLREVKVSESIDNLRDFAFEQGINYKILKRHNPWLRKNTLTVKRNKTYTILVPEPSGDK